MSLEPAKAVRRSHKKSRGGCITCKTRRVKCDESQPVCLNCSRRQTDCLWAGPDPTLRRSRSSSADVVARCAISSSSSPEPSMKRYKVPSFDMRALATIHHFTTSTALTFFDQPAYTLALQNVLPQIAMSQDFVMHGLFALANLHLHVLKAPASGRVGGHFQVAEDHFQWALQGFAEANSSGLVPQLSDINLIFNQMVAMFMFARPVTDEPDLPIQDTIEFLLHTRSFYNALTAPWKAAEDGVLTTPFFPEDLHPAPEVFAESLAFPAALANLHLPECGAPDPEEVRDPLVSQVYYEAIVGLMAGWTLVHGQNCYYARLTAIGWPSDISDEFVSYLDQKRPRALVLMAHWCASIVQFKETWWIRERGEKDIRSILSYLDQRWLPWMTIPIEALNDPKQWVPPPPPLALEQQSMATTPLVPSLFAHITDTSFM